MHIGIKGQYSVTITIYVKHRSDNVVSNYIWERVTAITVLDSFN